MCVQKYVCIYMYRRGGHFKAFQKEIYAIALDISYYDMIVNGFLP